MSEECQQFITFMDFLCDIINFICFLFTLLEVFTTCLSEGRDKYMDKLMNLLKNYKNNKSEESLSAIIEQMSPLVKKYARLTHCMEYDDAIQELYVTLIETLEYIDPVRGKYECLSYIKYAIQNKYKRLCSKNIAKNNTTTLHENLHFKEECVKNLEFSLDLQKYIDNLYLTSPRKSNKLYLSAIKNMSDKEVAAKLKISKQYVNRIKKQYISIFLHNYES